MEIDRRSEYYLRAYCQCCQETSELYVSAIIWPIFYAVWGFGLAAVVPKEIAIAAGALLNKWVKKKKAEFRRKKREAAEKEALANL